NQDILQGSGVNFPGPGFNVAGAAAVEDVFEFFSEIVNVGVFFQEQIGLNNYIYLTAGGRLDANSAFGSDFSTIFYPKLSASFIPSDAAFWRPIGPISSLRFRTAIGQSGLQPGAFDALTTYGAISSQNGAGIVPSNLGNPELKPEIATEWELGMEAGLFNDRLGLETTYWDRTVKDALIDRQFPVSGGFRARQLDNIGELKAKGLELEVNALVYNTPQTSVNVFANAAYLWEQVTDMGGAP
ncbi:TonB-dependent receptor, partial [Weissella cibaria]|nr:TonB-dependent receptor [Weissella cibaria]